MTTKQMDYCIELAHTLNFSRAAENMFVSQPTLTYQVKLLEDEVGFRIFERSGHWYADLLRIIIQTGADDTKAVRRQDPAMQLVGLVLLVEFGDPIGFSDLA